MKFVSKSFLQSVRTSQIVVNALITILEITLIALLHRTDYKLSGDELGVGLTHVFRFSISILSFISIGVSFRRFSHRWNIGQIQKDIYVDSFLALIWSLSSISNTIPLFYQEDSLDNEHFAYGFHIDYN
nr:4353_t:CDS:2 [Entrophospora candida]